MARAVAPKATAAPATRVEAPRRALAVPHVTVGSPAESFAKPVHFMS